MGFKPTRFVCNFQIEKENKNVMLYYGMDITKLDI